MTYKYESEDSSNKFDQVERNLLKVYKKCTSIFPQKIPYSMSEELIDCLLLFTPTVYKFQGEEMNLYCKSVESVRSAEVYNEDSVSYKLYNSVCYLNALLGLRTEQTNEADL